MVKTDFDQDITPEDVVNACMSYRHDYGLMTREEQEYLQFMAREWFRAWHHTIVFRSSINRQS